MSGVDVAPFLFASQSLSHAKKTPPIHAQHQQQCDFSEDILSGNKSSGVLLADSFARVNKRCEIVEIPASAHKERLVFNRILHKIDEITLDASLRMERPTAVMLRFTLLHDSSPSTAIQRLCEHCFRRGGVRPAFVWVRELSSSDEIGRSGDYEHFHAVLIFDRRCFDIGTIIASLKGLQARGWLESSHLSRDNFSHKIVVHDLKKPESAPNYLRHVGYMAKTSTKVKQSGKRMFGRSKLTNSTGGRPESALALDRSIAEFESEISAERIDESGIPVTEPIKPAAQAPKQHKYQTAKRFVVRLSWSVMGRYRYFSHFLQLWALDKLKRARPPPD